MTAPAPTRSKGIRLPRNERRAQLLDVSREVFVQLGYHAAAMDDIAERAGVSKPVLYQHFPGKLELYLALLEEGTEQLVASVRTALASTHENHERVDALVAAYFSFVDAPDGVFRLVFESDLTQESAVRKRIDDANVRCAELVAQVIGEETSLPDEEARLLGYGLIGLAQTAARAWLADGARVDREEAQAKAASLAWRGISGFPRAHE
jgi:AcrR family transcriptional regulator